MVINNIPFNCHVKFPTIKEDYKLYGGIGACKLYTERKTWNEAQKSCKEEGAHFAIINSRAENGVIIDNNYNYCYE